jgi:hypothetical protein
MQDVIAPNHRCIRIRQNGEGKAGFVGEIPRHFGRVDADRYRQHAGSFKLCQMFFDAS